MVGTPIGQVKTPGLLNPWFRRRSDPLAVVPVEMPLDGIECFVGMLRVSSNLLGAIVTIPHKLALAKLVDELSPVSRCLGAINVIRRNGDGRLLGDMLDGRAVVRRLDQVGISCAGKSAQVIGCGGAGSAIAYALAEAGVSSMGLHDIDSVRSESVAIQLGGHMKSCQFSANSFLINSADIVVNASPLGMRSLDELPFQPSRLQSHSVVIDAVTGTQPTALAVACAQLGIRVIDGNELAVAQAPLITEYFSLGTFDANGLV